MSFTNFRQEDAAITKAMDLRAEKNNKETAMKNIKDYLHLYLGCECQVQRVDKKMPPVIEKASLGRMLDWFTYNDFDIKPILRPLSDMTEEEKENAVDPMLFGLEHTLDHMKIYQSAELVEFLLSKHFDLFGLIEAGLALDKTKTD